MSGSRAYNAFLYMARENADEDQLERINDALQPPNTYRHRGAPVWWRGDEDAWEGWGI